MISLLIKNIQACIFASTLSLSKPPLFQSSSWSTSVHIFSSISVQLLLPSVIQHPCFTTQEAAVLVCRDKGESSTKWQKTRWILQCPLISAGCCLPAVTLSREQMCTHSNILPVSLFSPAAIFVLPAVLAPQEDISCSWACGKEGISEGRRGCCQVVGAEPFCQMIALLNPTHLWGSPWPQMNVGN